VVIGRGDKVADVVRRDESLIEVFARLSPALTRLRDPDMGRVMSRLVTVEQAARMAGIDAGDLVRRLNAVLDGQDPTKREENAMGRTTAPDIAARMPPMLEGIPMEKVVEVDVREDLRSGKEPFSRIMAALKDVPEGGVLALRAIFEPVPLYAVLARQGFTHYTERLAADDWKVWFYGERGPEADPSVVVLDVRELEPPEPMVRTLAALEELPPGGTLVQLNVRVPQFLLPRLEERGFTYEIREQAPDLVRVFIRRGPDAHTNAEEPS
jgi:uncharacterized protein (DUF2249 family)